MSGATIVCAGLVHVYRAAGTDIAALRGIDLAVRAGERVALLGPSGSGKSTLLAIVAGIRRPSAGAVLVGGTDLARLSEGLLRAYRAAIGTMLQGTGANLLGYASAADNVRQARRISRPRPGRTPIAALLEAAGLPGSRHDRPVDALPAAEQQLAALAVALANDPRVVVADEPTSGLEPADRDRLLDALLRITGDRGTTVLVVTHDPAVAARMDRTVHLRDGRVGAEGRERLAVVGADGAVLLPEHLTAGWAAGTLVRVHEVGADELRITRVEPS